MAVWDRADNWLAGIADADHPQHVIHNLNGLTVRDCQAAFDATYGKHKFTVRDHGTAITVFSNPGFITKLTNSRANAVEKGWDDRIEQIDKMIAKYQRIMIDGVRED